MIIKCWHCSITHDAGHASVDSTMLVRWSNKHSPLIALLPWFCKLKKAGNWKNENVNTNNFYIPKIFRCRPASWNCCRSPFFIVVFKCDKKYYHILHVYFLEGFLPNLLPTTRWLPPIAVHSELRTVDQNLHIHMGINYFLVLLSHSFHWNNWRGCVAAWQYDNLLTLCSDLKIVDAPRSNAAFNF